MATRDVCLSYDGVLRLRCPSKVRDRALSCFPPRVVADEMDTTERERSKIGNYSLAKTFPPLRSPGSSTATLPSPSSLLPIMPLIKLMLRSSRCLVTQYGWGMACWNLDCAWAGVEGEEGDDRVWACASWAMDSAQAGIRGMPVYGQRRR